MAGGVRYCGSCGKPVAAGSRFCGSCGKPVADDGGATRPPSDAPPPARTDEQEIFHLRPLAVQSFLQLLLCILTVGIAWVFLKLRRMSTSFRVTSQRIEIRSGIFTIRTRNVDLYRIQDMEVRQPLFLRLRASGDLLVRSMDPGEPVLLLPAIARVETVHETLRKLVQDERRRMNVRLLEEQS
jgi:hypothetical protein